MLLKVARSEKADTFVIILCYREPIKSASRIKAFNCPKKDSFIQKGKLFSNSRRHKLLHGIFCKI